jgi:antitoxin (DNA-binding transcriptional repressor) of toxin-antitoxin stability system
MPTIQIDEIQRDVLGYLRRVQSGETLIILEADTPIAEIKPVTTSQTQKLRPFGLCAGEFRVPDDFDEPLPEEIIKEFYGK